MVCKMYTCTTRPMDLSWIMRTLKVDRPTYGHLRGPFLSKCLCLFIDKVIFFRILMYHGIHHHH